MIAAGDKRVTPQRLHHHIDEAAQLRRAQAARRLVVRQDPDETPRREIVLIGFLDGDPSGIDFFDLFGSTATIRPIGVGDRTNLEVVVRAMDMAGVRPVIDAVFPFEDARAAFEHLRAGRHVGKIVIRVAR